MILFSGYIYIKCIFVFPFCIYDMGVNFLFLYYIKKMRKITRKYAEIKKMMKKQKHKHNKNLQESLSKLEDELRAKYIVKPVSSKLHMFIA